MSRRYETHQWNTGFHWPDHGGPFRTVATEQARSYDTDGYFVVPDAFDPATVAAVAAALAPLDREVVDFLRTQPGGRFSIAGVDTVSIALHPAQRSDSLRDFCAAPLFADLCLDLVGPDARLYWDQTEYP
jgi:phytanoyl-CoA hydroxylase